METQHISLPNNTENFLLKEMCARLAEGKTVTMLFGGTSMLPLINGNGDKIKLRPIAHGEQCWKGEVYMFRYNGHYVIHRLMKIKKDVYMFRGDNCVAYERVTREDVVAKLVSVVHADGSEIFTGSEDWQKQSKKVLRRKWLRTTLRRAKGQKARKVWSALYFVMLAVLMWAPLGGLGIVLDNYIFGLRADHLLHATVFLLCPMFLMDLQHRRKWLVLVTAVIIGLVTEYGQHLLPYRSFDINDLVANCVGNIIGWAAMLPFMRRTAKN